MLTVVYEDSFWGSGSAIIIFVSDLMGITLKGKNLLLMEQVLSIQSRPGLEKLINPNRSISTLHDRLFLVELTEIAIGHLCRNICYIRISDKS